VSAARFDVAIVGGGNAGCSAALHLALRGCSVILFERRLCGSQASGVNYGGVRQQGRDLVELPLSTRSRRLWDRLPELVGHDCEFMATGHLKLARSDEDMAVLEQWCEEAKAHGIESAAFGRNAIREKWPYFGDDVVGGTLVPSDGHANPRIVGPWLAKAARAAGADVRENCAVTAAERAADGFRIETGDGTEFRADMLLNVAGAWGSTLSGWFGEPVPETVMAPNMLVTEPVPYFLVPNLGVVGGDLYIRQIPRGNLIFGGGQGWADRDAIRARPLAEVTAGALERASRAIPAMARLNIIRSWSGIEGYMPDGIPVIGASGTTEGLIHAFGFSGHGFQLGLGIGELLAGLVIDGSVPEPLEPFDSGRFRSG
jgi:sarcosine oxidase subunit beta